MPKIYFEKMIEMEEEYIKHPSPAKFSSSEKWKKMQKRVRNLQIEDAESPMGHMGTIRSCPAINDAINFGYTMYSQVDIYIDSTQDNLLKWQWSLSKKTMGDTDFVEKNMVGQYEEYDFPEGFSKVPLKIHTGFGIKTDPGYSVWITSPIHQNNGLVKVFDSVADSDMFPLRDPINFMVKNNKKFMLPAGTPIIQVIPFKRENFRSEIVDFDKEDYIKKTSALQKNFINRYKKIFWQRKLFS